MIGSTGLESCLECSLLDTLRASSVVPVSFDPRYGQRIRDKPAVEVQPQLPPNFRQMAASLRDQNIRSSKLRGRWRASGSTKEPKKAWRCFIRSDHIPVAVQYECRVRLLLEQHSTDCFCNRSHLRNLPGGFFAGGCVAGSEQQQVSTGHTPPALHKTGAVCEIPVSRDNRVGSCPARASNGGTDRRVHVLRRVPEFACTSLRTGRGQRRRTSFGPSSGRPHQCRRSASLPASRPVCFCHPPSS